MVTLADVKTHLDINGTGHDLELPRFITAAEGMVRDWSTEVASGSRTELVTVFNGQVLLDDYPVTVVTAVETVSSNGVASAAPLASFWLSSPSAGILAAPYLNGTRLRVTYTAGSATPSPQFDLAVLECVAFLWRGRKGGSETYMPTGEPDAAGPPLLGGLKKRVLLILGDNARSTSLA